MCSTSTYLLKYNDDINFKIFGDPYIRVFVCCLSLYLNVGGLREGPGKSMQSPGIFFSKGLGTLKNIVNVYLSDWRLYCHELLLASNTFYQTPIFKHVLQWQKSF